MKISEFLEQLWQDYVAMTPQAGVINAAFADAGETVVNDHIAFRTLAAEPIGLKSLEPHLLSLGYQPLEPYEFPAKKLRAFGYLPPDPTAPRVFLSELLLDELSGKSASILRRLASEVDPQRVADPSVLWAGPLWRPISLAEYETLLAESEYAAWVATIGIRPNHFTIAVNHLEKHVEVEEVLSVVEGLGYTINESGGRVKGSPEVLLEQASTMADRIEVQLADGQTHTVPSCYYEFAKRYPTPGGELYPGFIAASADKIFESTDTKNT